MQQEESDFWKWKIFQQVTEKRMVKNITTHIIFVEREKTYYTVPLSKLFEVLGKRYIEQIYT